jgi:hypothetical protein
VEGWLPKRNICIRMVMRSEAPCIGRKGHHCGGICGGFCCEKNYSNRKYIQKKQKNCALKIDNVN